MRTAPATLLALALAACATARPGAEPIVTDRPDYTESPSVVSRPQLEAGVTRTSDAGATDVSVGELLLRLPVASRVEGRLNVGSLGIVRADGARSHGYEDPEVQAKIALRSRREGETRFAPDAALIVGTTIPVGSHGFTASTLQPGAKLVGEWELGGRFGLAANLNYARLADGARRYGETSATASLGIDLAPRLGSFVEYYDFLSSGSAAHYGDVGATYQLSPDFQLDARVGARVGAHLDGAERFVGVGVARRW